MHRSADSVLAPLRIALGTAQFGQAFRTIGLDDARAPAGRTAYSRLVGPSGGIPGCWRTPFDCCDTECPALAGINWQVVHETKGEPAVQTLLQALLA